MLKLKKNFLTGEKIFIFCLFLANSFLTWFVYTIQMLLNSQKRSHNIIFWSILSIVFISLYNATKIPENDLSWYVDYYLMAENYGLSHYITMLSGGKEPLYQILVYCLHFIGGSNVHFFIFSISLISYLFLLKGLLILRRNSDLSDLEFMLVVFFLCFFPWTFSLSVHLIRQFMALSMALYFLLAYYFYDQKKYIIGGIVSIFIHSSVIFILPFYFKGFRKPFNKSNLYLYAIIVTLLLLLSTIGNMMSSLFAGSNTLSHIATKAAYGTTFETSLPFFQLLASIIWTSLVFFSIYVINRTLKTNKLFNVILNFSLILLFFIIFNKNNAEIQLRYNFFYWSLFPFFCAIYLSAVKLKTGVISVLMVISFAIWNIYNLYLGQWTYTCRNFYFLYPSFWYFLD